MALSITLQTEKTKMNRQSADIFLFDVVFDDTETLYFCANNELITWNGHNYNPLDIGIQNYKLSSKGQLTNWSIYFDNVTHLLAPGLLRTNGGQGTTVILNIVNSAHLALNEPWITVFQNVLETRSNPRRVTFELGAERQIVQGYPPHRFSKSTCRYMKFKNGLCRYVGAETECDRSFARCIELGNDLRFGNCPSLGSGGIYA